MIEKRYINSSPDSPIWKGYVLFTCPECKRETDATYWERDVSGKILTYKCPCCGHKEVV